jgi:hypothetical protein
MFDYGKAEDVPEEARFCRSCKVLFSVIGLAYISGEIFEETQTPTFAHKVTPKMVQFTSLPGKEIEEEDENNLRPLGSDSSEHGIPNGTLKRKSESDGQSSKKKKKKAKSERGAKVNGIPHSKRRHSVSKPARDPRDEASPLRPPQELGWIRSPSPVIDFDGLSRPSKYGCP